MREGPRRALPVPRIATISDRILLLSTQFLRTRIDPAFLTGVSIALPLNANRTLSRFAFLTRDRLSVPVTRNAQLSGTVAVFRVSTFLDS